jgi:hypothetical protein
MIDSTPASAQLTSSSSLISGNLEIIRYVEFLAKEYPKAIAAAIKKAEKREQSALRSAAKKSATGWSEITEDLDVVYDESSSQFVYGIAGDSNAALRATDLEYGVPTKNAPSPLIRSVAKERELDLGKFITDEIESRLNRKYQ